VGDVNLVVVGMNHRCADVGLRENYAVASDDIEQVLGEILSQPQVDEAVILSTCNRVEVYAVAAEGVELQTIPAILIQALGPETDAFYEKCGIDAARHLFRVSASLDSMVVGEPQILGQVKEAYALAKKYNGVGRLMHGCFDKALSAAKRVRTKTGIARTAVSVGHVAVQLAGAIFGALDKINVLLIGAGKMGVLAAEHLAERGSDRVQVTNRTFERAANLAERHGWVAKPYDELPVLLQQVDVVICSTGSPTPVLSKKMVATAKANRRYRPLFLIDIAVPRDIEEGCGELDDVYLYNIDDLEGVSRTNAELRRSEINAAEALLEDDLNTLQRRLREQKAGPTIKKLREKTQALAETEAEKAIQRMESLSEQDSAKIRKMAQVIASRLTQGSIEKLKTVAGSADAMEYCDLVTSLFELEHDESE